MKQHGKASDSALSRRLVHDDVGLQHLSEDLKRWAGARVVSYELKPFESPEKREHWSCKVVVEGQTITDIAGAASKAEAMTRAAHEVLLLVSETDNL